MSVAIKIAPKRVLMFLIGAIVVLALLDLVMLSAAVASPESHSLRFIARIFNMDEEASLPTWFSQIVLLAAAITAFVIGHVRRSQSLKDVVHWYVISVLLLYMSIDEGSSIHEGASGILDGLFDFESTWLTYSWVLAGLLAALVVVLAFFKFWLRLPPKTRWFLFAAAVIFMLGAVGFEAIGSYVLNNSAEGAELRLIVVCEEVLELTGTSLVLYAGLDYLHSLTDLVQVQIVGAKNNGPAV
ncbi:hypothetical protein V5R04_02835 [Jonesiaceae bacterium BS-20]|uniref:Multidrug transporter n=1 Tax=Jonesiaceae bacterium BS-20 TaxID=3120821 RepID=A0AAU7DWU0_9MICO